MGNIHLYLRANERIFINGAVFKVDRKVSIELLNDTTFLLENHILQKEDATTPLKQLYFVAQLLLMDPANSEPSRKLFREMVSSTLNNLDNDELKNGIKDVDIEFSTGKIFLALKMLRKLYTLELKILGRKDAVPAKIPAQEKISAMTQGT